MSAYITMADLEGRIPIAHLTEALDDDGDGQVDSSALNAVLDDASRAVDAILGTRFAVPLSNPLPAPVVDAARVLACELIHQRRGKSAADNPFTKTADETRKRLAAIAAGETPLSPEIAPAKPSGTVIIGRAKTVATSGQMAV